VLIGKTQMTTKSRFIEFPPDTVVTAPDDGEIPLKRITRLRITPA